MRALVFGGSGALARSLNEVLIARGWSVDLIVRAPPAVTGPVPPTYATTRTIVAEGGYAAFAPDGPYDACFLPQAVFFKKPLAETTDEEIDLAVTAGLTDIIKCLRNLLRLAPQSERRTDYCLIGSTSSYAGFRDTAVYCAVKHGLLGLVRALNDEYAQTPRRFWLASIGAMDTPMGRLLTDQDPACTRRVAACART
ncbi:MAG TPA: SDR family oxidoreductase [Caulobacteraceae bacterium]